jgi:2-polyprenyl-3-methyl-5-hydroxy-6-metoxy-1,4-benzoquinol methylase
MMCWVGAGGGAAKSTARQQERCRLSRKSPEATTKRYSPHHVPRFGSLARLAARIQSSETVLDVGCSDGYLSELLSANSVWVVDGTPRAVERTRTRYANVAVADLNQLRESIFHERFDVIVFADVLDHLLDPRAVLVTSPAT